MKAIDLIVIKNYVQNYLLTIVQAFRIVVVEDL